MESQSVYQCSLDKTDCPLCCGDFESNNNSNQSTILYGETNGKKVCTRYLDKSNSHKGICQEFLPQVEAINISKNCFDTYIDCTSCKPYERKCNGEMCSLNNECKSFNCANNVCSEAISNTDLVHDSKVGKYYCNSLESNKKLSNSNCVDCNNDYLIKEKYIIGKVIDVSKENRKAFLCESGYETENSCLEKFVESSTSDCKNHNYCKTISDSLIKYYDTSLTYFKPNDDHILFLKNREDLYSTPLPAKSFSELTSISHCLTGTDTKETIKNNFNDMVYEDNFVNWLKIDIGSDKKLIGLYFETQDENIRIKEYDIKIFNDANNLVYENNSISNNEDEWDTEKIVNNTAHSSLISYFPKNSIHCSSNGESNIIGRYVYLVQRDAHKSTVNIPNFGFRVGIIEEFNQTDCLSFQNKEAIINQKNNIIFISQCFDGDGIKNVNINNTEKTFPYCTRCNEKQICTINGNELSCSTEDDNNFYGKGGECLSCPSGQRLIGDNSNPNPEKTETMSCSDCEFSELLKNQSCKANEVPIGCTSNDIIQCGTCSPGNILDDSGDIDICTPCKKGEYELKGSCTSCPDDKYQDSKGQTECKTCPLGYQPNADKTTCSPCSSIHANEIYTENCGSQTCLSGTQPNIDQTTCTPCPAGTAGIDGACSINCMPNNNNSPSEVNMMNLPSQYSLPGSQSCSLCPTRQKPDINMTGCESCEIGETTTLTQSEIYNEFLSGDCSIDDVVDESKKRGML